MANTKSTNELKYINQNNIANTKSTNKLKYLDQNKYSSLSVIARTK